MLATPAQDDFNLPCISHERSHFIVSENSQNRQYVSIPDDWSLPKFHLATLVQTTTVICNTTRIQTGEIVGLEYLKPDSYQVRWQGIKAGWSYIIKVDPDDPWYREEQTLYVEESNISLPDSDRLIHQYTHPCIQ